MATEKSWRCRINKNCNGDDQAGTAANWMLEYFNFLSGGEGGAGAWTIMSSSDASTVISGGVNMTAASDFTWAVSGSKHSWFVARKNILPRGTSSAEPTGLDKDSHRFIYHGVNLNTSNTLRATFWWDYVDPCTLGGAQGNGGGQQNTGSIYHSITSSVYAYDCFERFWVGHDAANPVYFHGTIDTTGSYHALTNQRQASHANQQFAVSVARLETPRSASVEHFPVYIKCGSNWHDDSALYYAGAGPWSLYQTTDEGQGGGNIAYYSVSWNSGRTDPRKTTQYWGGQCCMWDSNGAKITLLEPLLCSPIPVVAGINESMPRLIRPVQGPNIDGAWALMPTYVQTAIGAAGTEKYIGWRGRLPDVHLWNSSYGNYAGQGATIPNPSSSATHAIVGHWFLPFTGALLPGD